MSYFERFRYWIAKPLLDAQERLLTEGVVRKMVEAHETGKTLGRAIGQLEGQQMLLGQMAGFLDERHAEVPEITAADIERAKKGLVH